MSTISITGIANRLEKKFKRLGINIAQNKAIALQTTLSSIAKSWRSEIKAKLLKPASSRGYIGKHINPHDSTKYNNGFPMSVTGSLANAVWQRVTLRNTSDGSIINIAKGFSPVYNSTDSKHRNYGDILNAGGLSGANMVLKDFKQRAYDLLDKKILVIARQKGF